METRISIFGDSITWGAIDPLGGGWANRLRNYFDNSNTDNVDVYNLGISGDTSKDLLRRFETECQARSRFPQTIIFAIGTNDSRFVGSEDNPETPLSEFAANIQTLINLARKFSNKIFFISLAIVDESLVAPTPWYPDMYFRNQLMREYDQMIAITCKKNNLPFIDISDLLTPADLEDGLHPGAKGHEKIFQKILDAILKIE